MIFTLDNSLIEIPRRRFEPLYSPDSFAEKVKNNLDASFNYRLINQTINRNIDNFSMGFLETVSHGYTLHRKIQIKPQDLWFIVLTELANIIKKDKEKCRKLFSKSSEQIEIMVPTDNIALIDVGQVINQLKTLVPVDIEIFLPKLSTETPSSTIACYAAFCDAGQHYYSYTTFMCGIPEVEVLGAPEDWITLSKSCAQISDMFTSINKTDVVFYLNELALLFKQIAETITEGSNLQSNILHWKFIFTQQNVGSGGQLDINGWITKLYFNRKAPIRIDGILNSTIAVIPYKNLETKKEYVSVHGAFNQVLTPNRFLSSEFSSIVYQKTIK
jgi:hypothetical protein